MEPARRRPIVTPGIALPATVLVALLVACAFFMETFDASILSTSLPAIATDLGEDPISLKLALTAYLVSLAIGIPVSGWMADRFGARHVFRLAILAFLLGSVSCGVARGLPDLVGARVLQGLGGAMMVPVGRLLLLRRVARHELMRALSYVTIPGLLGPLAGPLVGGFITTYLHWRWIFLVNVPIGLAAVLIATFVLADDEAEQAAPLDLGGFLLCGFGLASLVLGLAVTGRGLLPAEASLAVASVGALSLLAYAATARRKDFPLIDPRLLSFETFRASVTGGSLFRIGIGSIPFLLPLMLQLGFGMNAFQSGAMTFASAAGAIFMKTAAPAILRRFGFRRVLVLDAVLSATCLAAYGLLTPSTPTLVVMGLLLVGGFVHSLQFTGLNAIAFAEIDGSRMSGAVAFSSVAQQLSLSLGIAVGAGVLQGLTELHGMALYSPENFRWTFVVMAAISLASVVPFLRLPPDAGAELAGNRGPVPATARAP